MAKIENDHQLEITCDWIQRFQRVLEQYKTLDELEIHPDIRQMCMDSTHLLIEKLEREIDEYLTQKAAETATVQAQILSASVPAEIL
jgi:hypothetical protein